MRTMRGTILAGSAFFTALLVSAPWAGAVVTQCVDTPIAPPGTTTFDDIVVPAGQTCLLFVVTVLNDVKAQSGSRLVVRESTIGGSVEGNGADLVQVIDSTVGKNIVIRDGGPAAEAGLPVDTEFCAVPPLDGTPCEGFVLRTTVQKGDVRIERMIGTAGVQFSTILKGDVVLDDNVSAADEFVSAVANSIDGKLQVLDNTGPGEKFMGDNTVGKKIQCFNNDAPVGGTPNTAPKIQGQCF